jgi:hypothetical protein
MKTILKCKMGGTFVLHRLVRCLAAMLLLTASAPFFVLIGTYRPDWCGAIGKFYKEVILSVGR